MPISQFRDKNLNFPKKPCLIPDLKFFQMPDGLGVQIRGGESVCILRGQATQTLLAWLLQVLDGSLSVEEIFAKRPADFSEDQLARALMTMFRRGVFAGASVEEKSADSDVVRNKQLLFYGRKLGITRANLMPEQLEERLANARLLLVGNGLFATASYDLLSRSGFQNIDAIDWSSDGFMSDAIAQLHSEPSEDIDCRRRIPVLARSSEGLHLLLTEILPATDLLVTATTTGSRELFEVINRLCLNHSVKWLRGNDDGTNYEIGPLVIPDCSACYRCLTLRRISAAEHAIEEELYEKELARAGEALAHQGEFLPAATMAAGVLTAEIVRIIGKLTAPSLENSVLTITTGGAFEHNTVVRVPRCPDCFRGDATTSSFQLMRQDASVEQIGSG